MNKGRVILIGVPCGVALAGIIWALLQPPAPAYQGQPLTYWLERYFPTNSSGRFLAPNPAAQEALRHIGTNAIPTLLRMTEAHDSALKLKLVALAAKQHLMRIRFAPAREQNWQAEFGFSDLGAAASNAVPALIRILDARLSPWSQFAAARALGDIGPAARQAVPSLCSNLAATNSDSIARVACILALGLVHAEPGQALPALIKALNDPDPVVRQVVAEAIGRFGADAQPAVPALLGIYDQNTAASSHAVTALGLIGSPASEAVPWLLRDLADTNLDVELRLQCILALGRIQAEPERVVPALIKSLAEATSDTDERVRFFCTAALGQFGPDATQASPLPPRRPQVPDRTVRSDATNARRLFDAAPAAGAGPK